MTVFLQQLDTDSYKHNDSQFAFFEVGEVAGEVVGEALVFVDGVLILGGYGIEKHRMLSTAVNSQITLTTKCSQKANESAAAKYSK